MSDCKVVLEYRDIKNPLYGLSYDDIPAHRELLEILDDATENVNNRMASYFFRCCRKQSGAEKYISDDEKRNFQIIRQDERETLKKMLLKLSLPGNEKKMKRVYKEFSRNLYMSANGKSYLLF